MLVGAGAVNDAWHPVIAALQANGFPDLVTADGANFALARLVYIARLAERDPDTTPIARRRAEVRAKLVDIKAAIARNLAEATSRGALPIRPEFIEVMRRFVLVPGADVGIITTNWDDAVERSLRSLRLDLPVFHVHGHMDDGDGLYLPTEVAEEPYRPNDQQRELVLKRKRMMNAISEATLLVIYGLGLSALDAELGQIVASGIHGSALKEIVVVNPHYVDVADRLATLNDAGSLTMPILCYAPNDLHCGWRFSASEALAESARISQPNRRPA